MHLANLHNPRGKAMHHRTHAIVCLLVCLLFAEPVSAQLAPKAHEVKPTAAEQEAYYRSHPDYRAMSAAPARAKARAGLFEDVQRALTLKGRMVEVISQRHHEYERAERAAQTTEDETLARLEEVARQACAKTHQDVYGVPPEAARQESNPSREESPR